MSWRCLWLCSLALSVTSIINVQARKVHNHVNSICSTWGREHFKTFDGDVYQFPGMCEYNLVSDCHESYQEFSVHMKRTEADGNPTVSYVEVTINEFSFHLTKSIVSVNDVPVNMPYYSAGVQLERNAIYTKLQAKVGIVVLWNGDDAVMVELDPEYANRTCGLCGDFNGAAVYNEFIYNDRKISPIEFGNRQKVHRPNDDCEDPYEEEDEPLDAMPEDDTCKEFQTTCDQLLRSKPWSSCASLLNPEPYIQACVHDMCGCSNRTDDFCVCSTLSEFSHQCSHAGGQPPNWRTPQFCAKQCPFNMVYEESGSPCMDTCTHSDTSSLCEDHKMDGCFCPPGTVFDDISTRGCIPQSECQCKHDKVYNPGDVYRQDRQECTCYDGRWSCKSLPSPATCAVEEGSHVTTFDGKAYTFHGDCYYTLAKVERKDDASPRFTILVQLVPCANQEFDTCLKSLRVLLNNDRNNVLVFFPDGTVRHNMQIISLPYHTGDINIFRASSFHILLQTSFGLQIQIQHVPVLQVYVTLEQSYKTKTRGLCGNYNMVLSDDMKTPQGMVEGTASSFGNSWKSYPTCEDREERLNEPCSLSVENERYAEHWCSLLTSPKSTFAQCHAMVDPEVYYKRCTYASCNCEKSEACLCAVFSSYARACASKGVFLTDWRENVCDKYAGSCPASQAFSYKLQRCQLTCRSLALEQQSCTSDFLPVDGCSCPEGFYIDDNGICVAMAKCPCYHNGVHIKPGKSIIIKEEHCVCTNGKLHCRSWRARSLTCPSPKEFFNCSTAGTGELGLQCARTCKNLDSDSCYSTECESGCQCPSGLIDDGKGHCVKEHECPCHHDGFIYAPGTQIPNQCNTCTCKRGTWECTEKICPATCVIYGSGHYNTFDQRPYGFRGNCDYIAAQRTEIKLSKGNYEVADLENGTEINYKVRNVGLYLVIESAIGVAVMWDRKTTVRIILEPQHSGEVCGLCGDFDGDGQNDFTTQGQLAVSSSLEFANSWKVSSSCPDAEADHNPCASTPNRHNWAKLQCGIIKGATFQNCHKKVDPVPFYENCVRDACACNTGGDCECFCTAVAAYAQACNEAGECVAWRTPDMCPVFCDYYNDHGECKWHYNPCHPPCFKTCLNPQGICNTSLPNLEGCYPVCPEDKPIFDEKKQICSTTTTPGTTTTGSTTTSTTTVGPTTTNCIPICEWSEWYDVDHPKDDGSDWETYENITNSGIKLCENRRDIECKATDYSDMDLEDFVDATKQSVTCNVTYGLICRKENQLKPPRKCYNYKIRVECCDNCTVTTTSPPTPPTTTGSTTTPSTTVVTTTTSPPTTTTGSTTTPSTTTPTASPTTTPSTTVHYNSTYVTYVTTCTHHYNSFNHCCDNNYFTTSYNKHYNSTYVTYVTTCTHHYNSFNHCCDNNYFTSYTSYNNRQHYNSIYNDTNCIPHYNSFNHCCDNNYFTSYNNRQHYNSIYNDTNCIPHYNSFNHCCDSNYFTSYNNRQHYNSIYNDTNCIPHYNSFNHCCDNNYFTSYTSYTNRQHYNSIYNDTNCIPHYNSFNHCCDNNYFTSYTSYNNRQHYNSIYNDTNCIPHYNSFNHCCDNNYFTSYTSYNNRQHYNSIYNDTNCIPHYNSFNHCCDNNYFTSYTSYNNRQHYNSIYNDTNCIPHYNSFNHCCDSNYFTTSYTNRQHYNSIYNDTNCIPHYNSFNHCCDNNYFTSYTSYNNRQHYNSIYNDTNCIPHYNSFNNCCDNNYVTSYNNRQHYNNTWHNYNRQHYNSIYNDTNCIPHYNSFNHCCDNNYFTSYNNRQHYNSIYNDTNCIPHYNSFNHCCDNNYFTSYTSYNNRQHYNSIYNDTNCIPHYNSFNHCCDNNYFTSYTSYTNRQHYNSIYNDTNCIPHYNSFNHCCDNNYFTSYNNRQHYNSIYNDTNCIPHYNSFNNCCDSNYFTTSYTNRQHYNSIYNDTNCIPHYNSFNHCCDNNYFTSYNNRQHYNSIYNDTNCTPHYNSFNHCCDNNYFTSYTSYNNRQHYNSIYNDTNCIPHYNSFNHCCDSNYFTTSYTNRQHYNSIYNDTNCIPHYNSFNHCCDNNYFTSYTSYNNRQHYNSIYNDTNCIPHYNSFNHCCDNYFTSYTSYNNRQHYNSIYNDTNCIPHYNSFNHCCDNNYFTSYNNRQHYNSIYNDTNCIPHYNSFNHCCDNNYFTSYNNRQHYNSIYNDTNYTPHYNSFNHCCDNNYFTSYTSYNNRQHYNSIYNDTNCIPHYNSFNHCCDNYYFTSYNRQHYNSIYNDTNYTPHYNSFNHCCDNNYFTSYTSYNNRQHYNSIYNDTNYTPHYNSFNHCCDNYFTSYTSYNNRQHYNSIYNDTNYTPHYNSFNHCCDNYFTSYTSYNNRQHYNSIYNDTNCIPHYNSFNHCCDNYFTSYTSYNNRQHYNSIYNDTNCIPHYNSFNHCCDNNYFTSYNNRQHYNSIYNDTNYTPHYNSFNHCCDNYFTSYTSYNNRQHYNSIYNDTNCIPHYNSFNHCCDNNYFTSYTSYNNRQHYNSIYNDTNYTPHYNSFNHCCDNNYFTSYTSYNRQHYNSIYNDTNYTPHYNSFNHCCDNYFTSYTSYNNRQHYNSIYNDTNCIPHYNSECFHNNIWINYHWPPHNHTNIQLWDKIVDSKPIGSGICLTIICSDICEIQNSTGPCKTTTAPTPTPTTPATTPLPPTCPEWDKVQNETFWFCNCTLARCIENNTIEIIPYECPPLETITCANGKEPVHLHDECCEYYACDCLCEGWGDPHYITFDGFFYSYQGNCTYVLMEERTPKYNLNIFIDNVLCDPTEFVSCPRSIIIAYGLQVITLKNHNLIGAVELEALKNGERLKLPYSDRGIKIVSSGIKMVLEIPELEVVVTFGVTGFSVNLPYKNFGKNTQGHCGTCNNNQADDCMLPGGQLVKDCAVMADYWPARHIEQLECHIPSVLPTNEPVPEPTQTPCKPDSVCGLLQSSVFEECHPFVSPDNFYVGCVFDSCHVTNPTVECTSLQAYAAACAQEGVCLHWRNHTKLCGNDCPSDKVYKPCGPAEQPTCEDKPNESIFNFTTEGCFCPDGMKLFNKESSLCVDKCGCLDADGIPREFNERFEHNCQNCICEESTKAVTCKPKVCPAPPVANCILPGFILVNQTNPSDHCCSLYGHEYVEPDSDECCGKCVQTHCVLNINGTNRLLMPGEAWSPPESKCEYYSCVKTDDTLIIISSNIICPPFQQSNCEPDTIQTAANGCCKICVEKEKGCKLGSARIRIKHNGCLSAQEVDMPYCEGSCSTSSRYSELTSGILHSCSCCQELRSSNRTVDLHCLNGDVVPHTYTHVEQCSCSHSDCIKPLGRPARKRRSFTLV
ncbi:uncharacterized protein muc2.1 [Polymixia lowei]